MTSTEDQRTTTEDWLATHWRGQARCPAGHDDAWSVGDTMAFVPGFVSDGQGPRIAHERGLRFVVLTCDRCGYVAFLDARVVGVPM